MELNFNLFVIKSIFKGIILGIGAGRDGTNSLTKIVKDIFSHNNHNGSVTHEKDHKFFYNAFSNMHNNPEIIEEVRNVIGNWSAGEAIIGNGYELFLPLIKEIHGNEIILIHLKRDKQSWLKSWKDNVKTFPDSHGNYSKSILPKIHRMAAYHFNECEIEEWRRWSLNRKASWYYDKTHYLVNKYKNDFKKYLFFETYQLSDPASSLEISRSCSKRWCNKKFLPMLIYRK